MRVFFGDVTQLATNVRLLGTAVSCERLLSSIGIFLDECGVVFFAVPCRFPDHVVYV